MAPKIAQEVVESAEGDEARRFNMEVTDEDLKAFKDAAENAKPKKLSMSAWARMALRKAAGR
jgi:hypothetical protein